MKRTDIRLLAEKYALLYNPDHVAPFPFENVTAKHDDLKVYYTALNDDAVSGAVLLRDGEYSILINTNKSFTRQHFTLGHELGHYFLHQDEIHGEQAIVDGEDNLGNPKILYRLDAEKAKRIEVEADNFAASLIMPEALVRKAWDATHSIQECARIFAVSPVAMSKRVTTLGLVSE